MYAVEEYATYVWTDPGQFGAWLTSEEQCALLGIFCFYPRGRTTATPTESPRPC